MLNTVNNGHYIKSSKDTLGDFIATWLTDHISTKVRPMILRSSPTAQIRHNRSSIKPGDTEGFQGARVTSKNIAGHQLSTSWA